MKSISFTPEAFNEYNDWFEKEPQIIDKIKVLIRDINRDAYKGLGKPEPLKGNWSGYWSRRIDSEHRLVYKVTDTQILIAKCKGALLVDYMIKMADSFFSTLTLCLLKQFCKGIYLLLSDDPLFHYV